MAGPGRPKRGEVAIARGNMTAGEWAAYQAGWRAGRASRDPKRKPLDCSKPPAEMWKEDHAEYGRRMQRWHRAERKRKREQQQQ